MDTVPRSTPDYAAIEHRILARCNAYAVPLSPRVRAVATLLNGPQAPSRRRRRRVAKKIAQRGGYMRCRGAMQAYLKLWPAMDVWLCGRVGRR